MKTADRENPKRWATTPGNRANGAAGQNRSCSFKGAAKEEKLQPQGRFFLLTSTFIELTRWYRDGTDVQKLLQQLSVYLGHTRLAATQAYLTMTPELLHEASLRFERYARREGSND